jgi:hypothetical protein
MTRMAARSRTRRNGRTGQIRRGRRSGGTTRNRAALLSVALAAVVLTVPAPPAGAVAPSRPGLVVAPLATGPGSIIQTSFGTEIPGNPGNFDAVVLQGNQLVHYWRTNGNAATSWQRGQVISTTATGPGSIIQSDFKTGTDGNLEVVVQEGSQVRHYFHDSSQPNSPWVRAQAFGTGVTGAPSMIQSDFKTGAHGNFEVVVPEGTNLVHYFHDNSNPTNPWQRGQIIATGISSAGSLIQTDFTSPSGHGNFEVLVQEGDHVTHFWHDNTSVTNPWARGVSFASGVTGAPSFIQSDFGREFGNHGNFEAAVRQGTRLVHWFHDSANPAGGWSQGGDIIPSGANSSGSLIQSTMGTGLHRNFEVVALAERAPALPDSRVDPSYVDYNLVHYFHNNANAASPWVRGQVVTYRGRSEKVCQVTGSQDPQTLQTTTNDTAARSDLFGTDLGYPVDDGKTVHMYFGDSRFGSIDGFVADENTPDDAVGVSTDTVAPTVNRCLSLTVTPGAQPFARLVANPPFKQGLFNVPSSGFTVGSSGYTIFWTDHCRNPLLHGGCAAPVTPGTTGFGRGVLTRNNADGATFTTLFDLPDNFHYTASLNANNIAGIPAAQNLGVYVWGVKLYRESYPTLAYIPAGSVENPAAWRYLTGLDANGGPLWGSDPAQGKPVFNTGDPGTGCVGEFSVSWVAPMQRWLMLYNCNQAGGTVGDVKARLATAPWGPWSDPTEVFHPGTDAGWCHFMHRPSTNPPCADLLGGQGSGDAAGDPYAPYVLSRFTRSTTFGTEIYFLMSTWNPYQVVVMRTKILPNP